MTLPDECILCGETRHRASSHGGTTTRYFDCGLEYNPREDLWGFFALAPDRKVDSSIAHLSRLLNARGASFARFKEVRGFIDGRLLDLP